MLAEILIGNDELRLRRAAPSDLEYILELQSDPENAPFIVPFDREFHRRVIERKAPSKLDIIIETTDGERCGYFMVEDIGSTSVELSHVIIGRGHKGAGVGHKSLRLFKKWAFGLMKFHRVWIDCKDFNERAIRLYSAEGFRREALFVEVLPVDGEYQSLIIFAMLRREYEAQEEEGLC